MSVTLEELVSLENNTALSNKIEASLWKAAVVIQNEDAGVANHANRLKLASKLLTDSDTYTERFYKYLLGANADVAANLAAITGASDATIDTQVLAAINIFADGT